MAPSPFRATALTCTVLVATLGAGLAVPLAATAAPATTPSTSSAVTASPVDDIPVDAALAAPRVLSITNTTVGSSSVMGTAGGDDVYLLVGDEIVDRSIGDGGLFQLFAQDRHKDAQLDLVRVHRAPDGRSSRTERIAMPRTLQVDGLRETNRFTPGTNRFTGSATAGATITATDASGAVLFTTSAGPARGALGSWTASTALAPDATYDITFRQTTTDGRTTSIDHVAFESSAAPAPVLRALDRRLSGEYLLRGSVHTRATAVEVQTEDGTPIASTTPANGSFSILVPADRVGETVLLVAKSGAVPSATTAVDLGPLGEDRTTPPPVVRDVHVHPDGRVQVIGERQKTNGIWVLDGDRVVAGYPGDDGGWSFTIGKESTGKQLDLVTLAFNGQQYSGVSERVALPRLLEVDGVQDTNTYVPGQRAFSGTAEAGATITATDQDGKPLFTTTAKAARSGIATWRATADLSAHDGYTLAFTQTTADGRTSAMRDIAFTAEVQETVPVTVTTKTVVPGISNHITGTATPGATFRVLNPSGTQIVPGTHPVADDGTWSFDRVVSKGATKLDIVIEQTVNGTATKSGTFSLAAATEREVTVTTKTVVPGISNHITGTATPGATFRVLNPSGTQIVPGTHPVADDGTWSFDRVVSKGATKLDIVIEQTVNGTAKKSGTFSLAAS
ncbi:hypothetical protein [Curtobacterium sp. PhB78]|uniref:hypothetical protein n=1 Tax=Curtobacterium sp. PhB78 TaxID=2485102 RepID=UPI000F498222|nr:hypothetical protein [Curtobacterium sp. PhB78]ROS36178.1 hypothetical protein EDF53_2145 [Curtobacterium sp. PhB78]